MNPPLSALWTPLLARLRHLLVVEGFGNSRNRFAGDIPVAARARSVRHLLALGPGAAARLSREWPQIEQLAIWPDLRQSLLAGDGPDPRSRPPAPPGPAFGEALLDPRSDDPRAVARQIVRRLAYLCREEFDDAPIGLLTLSSAWRSLRAVKALDAHLLEGYLDSTDTSERRVIRFCLRDLGFVEDWENCTDTELFRSIAERIDRFPLLLATAAPAQIERFERAGLLSASASASASVLASPLPAASVPTVSPAGTPAATPASGLPSPTTPAYTLAGGRFVIDRPFPGSRGDSLGVGIDLENGEPVLSTTLFVSEGDPLPPEAELALPHQGISPLLHLQRTELPDGLANVMVEALPRAERSDARLPLQPERAVALADRVAAILETVHATGRCVTGLRPELTFVDTRGEPILVPRGDPLRRLSWSERSQVEGQQAPFRDLYLAPEVLMGAAATPASDVYSLCAMLAYWIRSRHPFPREPVAAQLRAMLSDRPDCRGLPVPLYGSVALGLSAEPGSRPTLAELRRSFHA